MVWPAGRVARLGRSRRFEVSSASPRLLPRKRGLCSIRRGLPREGYHVPVLRIGRDSTPDRFDGIGRNPPGRVGGLTPAIAWCCSPSRATNFLRGEELEARVGESAERRLAGSSTAPARQERGERGGACRRVARFCPTNARRGCGRGPARRSHDCHAAGHPARRLRTRAGRARYSSAPLRGPARRTSALPVLPPGWKRLRSRTHALPRCAQVRDRRGAATLKQTRRGRGAGWGSATAYANAFLGVFGRHARNRRGLSTKIV
jgi:hypothetical protein